MNQLILKNKEELNQNKKKGFTLVELIIVIAIIAILAAIALPKFSTIRESSNVKADIANAKNIQTAVSAKSVEGIAGFVPTGIDTTITISDTNLATVMDGTVPKVKAKQQKGEKFVVTASSDGSVQVYAKSTADGNKVYPDGDTPWNIAE